MKEQIEQLIEEYERRIKTANIASSHNGFPKRTKRKATTQGECYKRVISDLEKLKGQAENHNIQKRRIKL